MVNAFGIRLVYCESFGLYILGLIVCYRMLMRDYFYKGFAELYSGWVF